MEEATFPKQLLFFTLLEITHKRVNCITPHLTAVWEITFYKEKTVIQKFMKEYVTCASVSHQKYM